VTLRARLTVAFLAVVLGPVLVGAVFVGGVVTAVGEDRSSYRLDLAASAASSAVTSLCQQLRNSAELVARVAPEQRRAVADDLVSRGQVAAVRVRDADGATTVATPGPPEQPWAQCHHPDRRAGASYAAIAAEVTLRDATGAPAGEVLVARALDGELLDRLADAAGVEVALLGTRTGGVAAETTRGLGPGEVGQSPDGRWVRRVEPTYGQPLPLMLATPRADPQPLYALLFGVVVVTAGLAVTVAWWLARSTTRPLVDLARAADRVADGDLSTRVPVRADDEAGQVAAAFNRMTHRTSTYVQALTASRDQLRGHLAVLGDTLSSTHDLPRILRVILQTAVVATGAAGGAVVLLDPATRTLSGQRTDPEADQDDDDGDTTVAITVPLDGSLLGAVATAGEARRGRVDQDWKDLHESEPRCRTYLAAPISAPAAPAGPDGAASADAPGTSADQPPPWPAPSEVRGVLVLYDRLGGDEFDDTDLVTLRTFAGHAAVAVDNVRTHEEAQRLSLTDPLTGLWNYRYLHDALRREVERAGRFGRMLTVLALDLDLFKEVNDVYGHPAGDAVLAEFARRIRSEIREVDSAFRQGGEEFVVLLPETDARGGQVVAQRLGAAVRDAPIVINLRGAGDEVPVAITVSIGVAVYPDHGLTPDDLLDAADDALYAAKAAGRDTYQVATATPRSSASAQVPVRPRDGHAADGTLAEEVGDPDASGGGAKPPQQSHGR
jgi:two-component system, cell cycle response regulator